MQTRVSGSLLRIKIAIFVLFLAFSVQVSKADLLVLSAGTNSVLRYDETSGGFLGAFVSAGAGGLSNPNAMVFGPDGNLYVTSFNSNQVMRFNGTTGAFISVFVSAGSGGLNGPLGLDFGPDGDLYVISYNSTQVLRYNGTTGAFVGVVVPFAPSTDLQFRPDGFLYLSYWTPATGGRIDRYNNLTFAFVNTFASWGGQPVDNFTFKSTGDLFGSVSHFNTGVVTVPPAGGTFSLFIPGGSGGLNGPNDVKFGADSKLYVASASNSEVLRYDGNTGAFIDTFVPSGSGGLSGTALLLFHSFPSYAATIQQPINSDGSSVFNYRRGMVPVKFTLTLNGTSTCELPPATISLYRTSGMSQGLINEGDYIGAADTGSDFRISGCQYVYNLDTKHLGVGAYAVKVSVNSAEIGSATFGLN